MTLTSKDNGIAIMSDLFSNTTARVTIKGEYNCCSGEFTEEVVFSSQTCWYNVTFETALLPDSILSELVVSDGTDTVLLVGGPIAYDLSDDNHVSIMESHINNYLQTEDYNGSFRVYKSEGLDIDSLITLQFNGTLAGFQPNVVHVGGNQYTFNTCPQSHTSVNIADGTFCVTPEFFNRTELVDGIYRFTIVSEDSDGSLSEETSCFFYDVNVKCDIVKVIELDNFQAHRLYEGIVASINCESVDCDCKQACDLFESLVESLDKTLLDDHDTDCGCTQ